MLALDTIYKASTVLSDVVCRTNVIHEEKLNPLCNFYLKPENLQVTGSFKVRGAGFKISQLTDEEKARGLLGRQSCAGRGPGCPAAGYQGPYLYAGFSPHQQGGGHA